MGEAHWNKVCLVIAWQIRYIKVVNFYYYYYFLWIERFFSWAVMCFHFSSPAVFCCLCIFFFASILANKLKLYFPFLFKQMKQGKKTNENKIKTKDKLNYSRIFCILQVWFYMANCQ